jgi:hypothetical protein
MKRIDLDRYKDELLEDEYLLKVYTHKCSNGDYDLGFMTKFNKNGSIPVAFDNWKPDYRNVIKDAYIITEEFRSGWKVVDYRAGKSQDWVVVKHPLGFRIEIYMKNFFRLMEVCTITNGVIDGSFMWFENTLIKEI